MKFMCPVLAVRDIAAAREFYEKVLNQKVTMDFGANITFEGLFALQQDFAGLIGINKDAVTVKPNNFEIYFEEEDLDAFVERLKNFEQIEYVHGIKEYPWGQRVIRFYDLDKHMIEVGESMESVIKRFLDQGLSVEETSARTMYPLEFVKRIAG